MGNRTSSKYDLCGNSGADSRSAGGCPGNGRGARFHRRLPAGAAHHILLEGREQLTVSGVEDVERFDETGIIMSTAAGTLVVTGEDLHIGKLSLDGGELHVDGRIDAVSYEDGGQERQGFFRRLFG